MPAARASASAATIAAAVAWGSHSSPSVTRWIASSIADREHVAQLLLGLRRPERQHRRGAAVGLDSRTASSAAHSSCGLIVKPRWRGVDRLRVVAQDDPPAGDRYPLDGDEDVHQLRMREFSGSKIGVEPTTATRARVALAHVLDGELLADGARAPAAGSSSGCACRSRVRRRRSSRRSAVPGGRRAARRRG